MQYVWEGFVLASPCDKLRLSEDWLCLKARKIQSSDGENRGQSSDVPSCICAMNIDASLQGSTKLIAKLFNFVTMPQAIHRSVRLEKTERVRPLVYLFGVMGVACHSSKDSSNKRRRWDNHPTIWRTHTHTHTKHIMKLCKWLQMSTSPDRCPRMASLHGLARCCLLQFSEKPSQFELLFLILMTDPCKFSMVQSFWLVDVDSETLWPIQFEKVTHRTEVSVFVKWLLIRESWLDSCLA